MPPSELNFGYRPINHVHDSFVNIALNLRRRGDTVQIVAYNFRSLAAPRVVGQQVAATVNNYPGAAMDTIGTEAPAVITELKEAIQVDEGRVKSFLE